MFKNRLDEINLLEDLHQQNKPKLIVLYPKRSPYHRVKIKLLSLLHKPKQSQNHISLQESIYTTTSETQLWHSKTGMMQANSLQKN